MLILDFDGTDTGLSSDRVRFFRDQDISSELDRLGKDIHVLRATFYPFAVSPDHPKKQVCVPVKNGDIQKWRQCMYKLTLEESGWKLLSVDQE